MIWTTAICLLSGLYLLTLDTTMARCINCLIAIPFNQLYLYEVINMSPEIITIIEEWIVREVAEGDMICQECFNLVLNELPNEGNTSEQQVGHHHVCVCCGISIARITRRRSRPLLNHNAESAFIASIISPNQIPPNGRVCDNCWQRARRHVQEQGHVQVDEPVEQPAEAQQVPSADVEVVHSSASSITEAASASVDIGGSSSIETEEMILEGYSRTSDSTRHCFVPDCINTQRLRVPLNLKRKILTNYKLYITPNARICEEHSGVYNWEFLETYEFTSTFQRVHIVEMLNLLTRETNNNLDFERVEEMNNTTCRYWTGLSILNFLSILNCLTQLPILCRRPKTALAIYLIRLRTGEPYRRLASLFLMSTFLICSYLKKVRSCLEQEYVHLYLGCNNIPRESLSNRNLLIPQGLFGTSQNNPIIIMDGTYVYLNKSSNYFFQKQTYSLHKYNNLVKPFLMVASDGYIIDAFGPYAATTSDADIVNQLFGSPVSPLRSYYTEGDVFLLDRGFRDAEGLLTSLGFKIHKPESLDVGESQLTTIKANKSRLVTLCRWVVEVVNGRFKRDYKIFRNKYLNIASKNLMSDFRIAAAIINNFHPLITDRQDAQLILDRALQRLHMPNYLANHVIQQNLNRRRVSFVRIDAQIPQLDMFPVMEMSDLVLFSLGIYQIKQARSYYGEHIRNNGTFIVEVSDDINAVTVEGIPSSLHETVLIRGRIRSRHQSQKIYYTYILLNLINSENWQEKISNYYCSCIVGKRTVGSCAHVMTIVWYLGWARHQNNITPPAQLLDNILVREDED